MSEVAATPGPSSAPIREPSATQPFPELSPLSPPVNDSDVPSLPGFSDLDDDHGLPELSQVFKDIVDRSPSKKQDEDSESESSEEEDELDDTDVKEEEDEVEIPNNDSKSNDSSDSEGGFESSPSLPPSDINDLARSDSETRNSKRRAPLENSKPEDNSPPRSVRASFAKPPTRLPLGRPAQKSAVNSASALGQGSKASTTNGTDQAASPSKPKKRKSDSLFDEDEVAVSKARTSVRHENSGTKREFRIQALLETLKPYPGADRHKGKKPSSSSSNRQQEDTSSSSSKPTSKPPSTNGTSEQPGSSSKPTSLLSRMKKRDEKASAPASTSVDKGKNQSASTPIDKGKNKEPSAKSEDTRKSVAAPDGVRATPQTTNAVGSSSSTKLDVAPQPPPPPSVPRPRKRQRSNSVTLLEPSATAPPGPAPKRPRPSVTYVPAAIGRYTRSETHWYLDGSLLVQLEKTRFKLHRSRMVKVSGWVRYLLGDVDERLFVKREMKEKHLGVDGEEVVVKMDGLGFSVGEFGEMLDALDEAITFVAKPPSFLRTASILRVAHKLDIPMFESWARDVITKTWSANLDDLTPEPIPYAVETVALARQCNLPSSVLKRALYEIVRRDNYDLDRQVGDGDGMSEEEEMEVEEERWVEKTEDGVKKDGDKDEDEEDDDVVVVVKKKTGRPKAKLDPLDLLKVVKARGELQRRWLEEMKVRKDFMRCFGAGGTSVVGEVGGADGGRAPSTAANSNSSSTSTATTTTMTAPASASTHAPASGNPTPTTNAHTRSPLLSSSSPSTSPSPAPCASTSPSKVLEMHSRLIIESDLHSTFSSDVLSGYKALIDIAWEEEGFCGACVEMRREVWAKTRERIWRDCDILFGVGGGGGEQEGKGVARKNKSLKGKDKGKAKAW
ncbi:hypothetical protein CC2G_004416 [Coprinopsis cinerea AmutBmut pab1-1]|nr:hypothetical protein CC2G_004416 [Coprinopsis cinerea AmutBmut pab1-1]